MHDLTAVPTPILEDMHAMALTLARLTGDEDRWTAVADTYRAEAMRRRDDPLQLRASLDFRGQHERRVMEGVG